MGISKTLIEWRHTVLSLPSVDTLYNYTERKTPDEFNPDPRLTAFHIYTTKRSPKPRIQPQHNNSTKHSHCWAIEFHDAQRPVIHVWDSDIIGLRLNHEGSAWFKWDDNKAMFHDLLVNKPRFAKAISDPDSHPTGVTPLWVLRSFFIGPDTSRCPPYITVMCSKESLSRHLVDCIRDKLQGPQMEYLADWGVTRLPNVHVSEFGSPTESPSRSPENLPQHEEKDNSVPKVSVHLTERGLPLITPNDVTRAYWNKRQHRCGIRLSISRDSRVYAHATIGGLIQVGETIFGLTVSHVFSEEYGTQKPGIGQQGPTTVPTNRELEAVMDSSSTLSGRWRNSLRQSMVFDWALVEMPSLETYNSHPNHWENVNLVNTINGDFRPVLVVPEIPVNGTPVVLATPGSALCLRGIVTGEDAFVNMPGSPSPYTTWVLRMEQPWLIRPGDSGTWAFDAGNGDLLGILVAGCPELHEAYVIPAHEVFGHIRGVLEKDVRLPNSYSIIEEDHHELTRLEKTILGFKAKLELLEITRVDIGGLGLERIEKGMAACFTRAQVVFSNGSHDSLNYRRTNTPWQSILRPQRQDSETMKKYEDTSQWLSIASETLTSDNRRLCEDLLRRSPLECSKFVFSRLRDISSQSHCGDHDIKVPVLLGVHLILGEGSLRFSGSHVSTDGYHISQVIDDERRSCASYPMFDFPRDRSSFLTRFFRIRRGLEHSIDEVKEYCKATLPEKAPFDNIGKPILLIAVLLNKDENRILVLDSGREGDRSIMNTRFLWLPCIQVNEALGEKESLKSLLSTEMALQTGSCDLAKKIDLDVRSSRFWLKDHKAYVDVVAYQMVLSDDAWQSVQSYLYGMAVTSFKLQYAADHVYGLQDRRVLQSLGYWSCE